MSSHKENYFSILASICQKTKHPNAVFGASVLYQINKINKNEIKSILYPINNYQIVEKSQIDIDKYITDLWDEVNKIFLKEEIQKLIFEALFMLSDYNNHVCDEVNKIFCSIGEENPIYISMNTSIESAEMHKVYKTYSANDGIVSYQYRTQCNNSISNDIKLLISVNETFFILREKMDKTEEFLYVCPISPKYIGSTHHLAMKKISMKEDRISGREYENERNAIFYALGDDFCSEFKIKKVDGSAGAFDFGGLIVYRGNIKDLYLKLKDY